MDDLKFDICGFTARQTRPEYIDLLDEALSLTDELNKQIDTISICLRRAPKLYPLFQKPA